VRSAVIVFPGSNCDRDAAVALKARTGHQPAMVWHRDSALPQQLDLILIPGGFSYGDYLRAGAMAGNSPIMLDVVKAAEKGIAVLGICNGFQVLTETGLLPGTLLRNSKLNFICKNAGVTVQTQDSIFTSGYRVGSSLEMPIAHHDGNYYADEETLNELEGEDRVAFCYSGCNPNGSQRAIAGILNKKRNVLGMMPHPERAVDAKLGGTDGLILFDTLAKNLM